MAITQCVHFTTHIYRMFTRDRKVVHTYRHIMLTDATTPEHFQLLLTKVWKVSMKMSFKNMRCDDDDLPEMCWGEVTCRLDHLITCSTGKLKWGFAVSTMKL